MLISILDLSISSRNPASSPRCRRPTASTDFNIHRGSIMTASRFDLSGQVVVVTGGGKGLGKVYAQEFARAGALVVASDIDGAGAKAVAQGIVAEGGKAIGSHTDIS